MTKIYLAAIAALFASTATAQDAIAPLDAWQVDRTVVFEGTDIVLDDFIWQARPLIVFADSPFDPLFIQQMELLAARVDELAERDVIVITDTDPSVLSDLRRTLRPRAFMLTLIGKDGQIKLRKPAPWDVRELSRSIDKTPLRQQEIRDRRVIQ